MSFFHFFEDLLVALINKMLSLSQIFDLDGKLAILLKQHALIGWNKECHIHLQEFQI